MFAFLGMCISTQGGCITLHYWEYAMGRGCNKKANKCFTFVLFPVKIARIMLIEAVKGKSLALSHSPVIYDK